MIKSLVPLTTCRPSTHFVVMGMVRVMGVVTVVSMVGMVFGPMGFFVSRVSRVSVLPANTAKERILRRTALSGCHIYLSQIFLHIPLHPKPFMLTTCNNNIVFLYLQYYFTKV
jgi:hypothetical protein